MTTRRGPQSQTHVSSLHSHLLRNYFFNITIRNSSNDVCYKTSKGFTVYTPEYLTSPYSAPINQQLVPRLRGHCTKLLSGILLMCFGPLRNPEYHQMGGFPTIRDPLLGSLYNRDHSVLGSILGPLIFGNSQIESIRP